MSWSAPGTVAQPAPVLAFSTRPISAANPGWLVKLPDPQPLDVTERYGEAAAVSFTDGLNGQTTYFYHVQLKGLKPGTRYYYQVSDGAATPVHGGRVVRDRAVRPRDVPLLQLRRPGHARPGTSTRRATSGTSPATTPGTRSPRSRTRATARARRCSTCSTATCATPTWTSTTRRACGGTSASTSAAARRTGRGCPRSATTSASSAPTPCPASPGSAPGGIAAQGAAGNHWSGPYGFGHYLSRFLLPDNGITNWDGNRLRGNFYAFQVGTVQVHLARRGRRHLPGRRRQLRHQHGEHRAGDHHHRRRDPERHHQLHPLLHRRPDARREGQLAGPRLRERQAQPADHLAGADPRGGPPRPVGGHDRGVHAPVSRCPPRRPATAPTSASARPGCRCSTSTRSTWCCHGHEHDYERTYPVRGYDAGELGTVVAPNPGQTKGAAVDTRRPSVVTTEPYEFNGTPAWNTARGHRVPGARRRRHQRADQQLRHRHRRRQAAGQGHHHAERGRPAARRPGSSRTAPTRSRTRPGPRPSTRPTPTGTPSSTLTRASTPARRPSPSSTSRSRR